MKYIIVMAILASLPPVLSAETYKWVNEDGVVTYSQSPPPDIPAEKVKVYGGKPPSGAESSQSRLNQLRQKLEDSAEDRELEKQKRQEAKQESDLKQRNCEAARSNLRKLEGLGNRLYEVDGEYRRLTEEERQDLMRKEQEHIKQNCEK